MERSFEQRFFAQRLVPWHCHTTRIFCALFAAGSVLFLVSDIVLILNTFGKETRQSLRVTNISLYYLGQLLIALSLLFLK